MANLTLVFDPGSSSSKIVHRVIRKRENRGKSYDRQKLLLMEPEIVRFPESALDSLVPDLSMANVEDSAWVKEKKRDEEVYLLGFLALRSQARLDMKQLKYESAAYKIMGAVGAVAQKYENYLGNKFNVAIAVLLPYGEYSNGKRLEEQIKSKLKRFYFRGEKIQASLKSFRCLPEGGGIAMSLASKKGPEWLKANNVAIFVFGHRNTSLLHFQRGTIQAGETTNLGFHQVLDSIIRQTSGQDSSLSRRN
ncbi:MAG: ParM/StbA family protein [Spirulinaceae cyanobacterium]